MVYARGSMIEAKDRLEDEHPDLWFPVLARWTPERRDEYKIIAGDGNADVTVARAETDWCPNVKAAELEIAYRMAPKGKH